MNTLKIALISFFIFCNYSQSIAQLAENKLRELSNAQAERYSEFLDLNVFTKDKLADIFYYHDALLASKVRYNSNYFEVANSNATDRETSINKLLGDRKYSSYKILKDLDDKSAMDYYSNTSSTLQSDEALMSKVTQYITEKVFPVLSELKVDYDKKIKKKDLYRINQLADQIYDRIDAIEYDTDGNAILSNEDNQSSKIYSDLISYANKYNDAYKQVLISLSPYEKVWKKDIEGIILQNYAKSEISALAKVDQDLAKTGVKSSIDKLSFMLIEPYSIKKFFKNIAFISLVKQTIITR